MGVINIEIFRNASEKTGNKGETNVIQIIMN